MARLRMARSSAEGPLLLPPAWPASCLTAGRAAFQDWVLGSSPVESACVGSLSAGHVLLLGHRACLPLSATRRVCLPRTSCLEQWEWLPARPVLSIMPFSLMLLQHYTASLQDLAAALYISSCAGPPERTWHTAVVHTWDKRIQIGFLGDGDILASCALYCI